MSSFDKPSHDGAAVAVAIEPIPFLPVSIIKNKEKITLSINLDFEGTITFKISDCDEYEVVDAIGQTIKKFKIEDSEDADVEAEAAKIRKEVMKTSKQFLPLCNEVTQNDNELKSNDHGLCNKSDDKEKEIITSKMENIKYIHNTSFESQANDVDQSYESSEQTVFDNELSQQQWF